MLARTLLPLVLVFLPKLAFGDPLPWEISVKVEPAEITFLGSLPVEKIWVEGKSVELTPPRENPLAAPNQIVISDKRVDLRSFHGREFYVHYAIPSDAREIRFTLVDAQRREREGVIPLPEISATLPDSAPAFLAGDVRVDPPAALAVALALPPGYQLLDRFSKAVPGDRPVIHVVARQNHGEYPIFLKSPDGWTLVYRLAIDFKLPEGLDWPRLSKQLGGASPRPEGTLSGVPAPRIRHPRRWVWTGMALGAASAAAAAVTYYNARVQDRVADQSDDPARKKELRDRVKIENAAVAGLSVLSGFSFGLAATVALAW